MKDTIILNKNDERNRIVDSLMTAIKNSTAKFHLYKKAMGEYQQAQRNKKEMENKLMNFKV